MDRIIYFFKKNKVQIRKLNHCLAEREPTEFDSIMQLSENGRTFTITNKIPSRNAHLKTADSFLVEHEKLKCKDLRKESENLERFGLRETIVQTDNELKNLCD